MSAEFIARRRLLALLKDDDKLCTLAHAVFDGEPAQASPPYIAIGTANGERWGSKDRPGRQVRLALIITAQGAVGPENIAAQIIARLPKMRGHWEGWDFSSVRPLRVRLSHGKDRTWRYQQEILCNMLQPTV